MSHCKLKRSIPSGAQQAASNPQLATENNKKLDAMLAERAKQDALLFGVGVQEYKPHQQQHQQQQQQQPKH